MTVTYKILENGYDLFLDGDESTPWIHQPEPYAKLYVPTGSYEDNAKAHITELTKPAPTPPSTNEELSEGLAELTELVISNTGGTTV